MLRKPVAQQVEQELNAQCKHVQSPLSSAIALKVLLALQCCIQSLLQRILLSKRSFQLLKTAARLASPMHAGLVHKDKVAVMGGSHGGFLTGNLVGQFPDAFKCGVLRNPVMDISLMIHVSDIPDWTYVEAFGSKVLLHNDHSCSNALCSSAMSDLLLCKSLLTGLSLWFPADLQCT